MSVFRLWRRVAALERNMVRMVTRDQFDQVKADLSAELARIAALVQSLKDQAAAGVTVSDQDFAALQAAVDAAKGIVA